MLLIWQKPKKSTANLPEEDKISKGSNSSTTTGQSSSSSSPNPVAMKAYKGLLARAQNVSNAPFQAYGGNEVAPINEQQTTGVGNINTAAQGFAPFAGQAGQDIAEGTAPVDQGDIQQYMDPYTQSVINATQTDFDTQNERAQSAVTGNAAAQHALGGNRVAVAQALTQEGQERVQAPVIAGLRSSGFKSAEDMANTQKAREIAGGAQLSASDIAAAQSQFGAGTAQQTTTQAGYTQAMTDYYTKQGYPFATAQWLASIALPTGSQMGGTTSGTGTSTTQGPQPNQFAQFAGLGLTAASIFSDKRLKENIKEIGKLHDGQKIYRYNFKGDPTTQVGLISQEVEKHHPEAVHKVGGFGKVDYDVATEDAVKRWSGGAIRGFADGGLPVSGTPWSGASGWVPTVGAPRGAPLQPGRISFPTAHSIPAQSTDYSKLGKSLGTVAKQVYDKYGTPTSDATNVADTDTATVNVDAFNGLPTDLARGGAVSGFAGGGWVPVNQVQGTALQSGSPAFPTSAALPAQATDYNKLGTSAGTAAKKFYDFYKKLDDPSAGIDPSTGPSDNSSSNAMPTVTDTYPMNSFSRGGAAPALEKNDPIGIIPVTNNQDETIRHPQDGQDQSIRYPGSDQDPSVRPTEQPGFGPSQNMSMPFNPSGAMNTKGQFPVSSGFGGGSYSIPHGYDDGGAVDDNLLFNPNPVSSQDFVPKGFEPVPEEPSVPMPPKNPNNGLNVPPAETAGLVKKTSGVAGPSIVDSASAAFNDVAPALGVKNPAGAAPTRMAMNYAEDSTPKTSGVAPQVKPKIGIGDLTAKYESSGDWGAAGPDNKGWSYGRYQFNSRGSLNDFMHDNPQYAKQFSGMSPESAAFAAKWRQLSNDPDFRNAQNDSFVKHAQPSMQTANSLGFDTTNRGVQEAVLSGSIQHGNFQHVLAVAAKSPNFSDNPVDQLSALYKARANYVDGLDLDPATKNSVLARYQGEYKDAVNIAGGGQPADISATSRSSGFAPSAPATSGVAPKSGMGGINPFGLSDEARQGLISMGLGMMANPVGGRGSFMTSMGRGGEQGWMTYANAKGATAAAQQQQTQNQLAREKFDRPYNELTMAEKSRLEEQKRQHDLTLKTPVKYGEDKNGIGLYAIPRPGPNGVEYYPIDPETKQMSPTPLGKNPTIQPGQPNAPQSQGVPQVSIQQASLKDGIIPANKKLMESGAFDYTDTAPYTEKGMDVPDPKETSGKSAQSLKTDAEYYLQTGKLPPVRSGKSPVAVQQNNYRNAVQNYAGALAQSRGLSPEQTADMWRTAPGMLRFILGADGRATVSLGTAVRHLDTLKELATAWAANDIQTINKIRATMSREFGESAVTNLEAAGKIVGPEIIKAIGVAGAGTADERLGAEKAFSSSVSPKQMLGAIEVTQKLLGGQLEGRKRQAANAGVSEDRFKSLIGDRPYEILSHTDTKTPAAASAAPTRVKQNGHTYEKQADGSYKAID